MPRIAFRLWLKPDAAGIETYVHHHLHPFDGLYDLIRAAGIQRYTIWLDGTDLFLTREGATPEVGERLDMQNPVHAEWAATMKPLFQERVFVDGAGRPEQAFAFQPTDPPGPPSGQMTYRAGLVPGEASREAVAAALARSVMGLAASLRAAGVKRAWTFLEDGDAWTYVEADSLESMESALGSDPVWTAFWRDLGDALDERTRAEGWRRTREVFRCD